MFSKFSNFYCSQFLPLWPHFHLPGFLHISIIRKVSKTLLIPHASSLILVFLSLTKFLERKNPSFILSLPQYPVTLCNLDSIFTTLLKLFSQVSKPIALFSTCMSFGFTLAFYTADYPLLLKSSWFLRFPILLSLLTSQFIIVFFFLSNIRILPNSKLSSIFFSIFMQFHLVSWPQLFVLGKQTLS